jgi:hypothetical protein
MCKDFAPKFGEKRTIVTHPPYFSLFFRLKIKLKGHHFDTVEMIEAESQAMLYTFTEHDFRDAFKKCKKRWERCIDAEGNYFEGKPVSPKLVLTRWQHQFRKL